MFEDKRKSRIKRVLPFLGFVLIVFFIISYFVNNGHDTKEDENVSKVNKNFLIPNEIKSLSKHDDNPSYNINEATKLCYITYFKSCGHEIERVIPAPVSFIGLNVEDLKARIEGWEINEIIDDNIILSRDIYAFCPRHFIIGVKDDNIAIYVYNENGEKILKEKTDIDINILTPEDQAFLTSGIVADTEDDMEQKLEGFSN